MSTIIDYRIAGPLIEGEPSQFRDTDDSILESGGLVDEYRRYVTYNLDNGGSNLLFQCPDDFGNTGIELFGGGKMLDASVFDFGSNDFTIKMQCGLGGTYYYNELEEVGYIPILTIGNYSNPVFCFGMHNIGTPNYVQQGDLYFTVTDTEDNEAFCFMSSLNFFLPSYGAIWHIEISRTGQVFSFKFLSGYGQYVVSHTFSDFGTMKPVSGLPVYFFTGETYGSVKNQRVAIQATSGISRSIGQKIDGKYNTYHTYPSLLRKKPEPINISEPIQLLKHGHLV